MSGSSSLLPPVVILAAGCGRRLAGGADQPPKVLLEFGGRTLLQRHLELLEQAGAGPVSLVVGYRRGAIEAELGKLGRSATVGLIDNPDWREGSVVSLDRAGGVLRGAIRCCGWMLTCSTTAACWSG